MTTTEAAWQRTAETLRSKNRRLRTILLGHINWLKMKANAHEGEDFGNACRKQAEQLRGEMRDV